MHQQLHERKPDQIPRLQPQHAQQRQHIERVDQVWQRLGSVVDLHRPAQVILQVIGDLHHIGRFDDPLAAARRNEETEHRRVHAHQQRVGVVGGDGREEGRNVVGQGLAVAAFHHRHQRGNRAVQRELDQHAGGGGHRTGHRIKEAARAPVQQGADHDEQEVVGVQPRNCTDCRLGRKLVEQPTGCQQRQQDGQQWTVFQPFTGSRRCLNLWQVERRVDATGLGITRAVRAGRGSVGDDQRDHDQRQQQHAGLPQEDGVSERDHPRDRQNRRRQAGRVGLQLRGGRRQPQRPYGAQPQIRRGTGRAVIHLQIRTTRQRPYQQTAEH